MTSTFSKGATALPDGWRLARLGEVAEVVMGQSPPGTTVFDWNGNSTISRGLPFIQGNAEFGAQFPKPLKWCAQPAKVARADDLLISVRAPVGETNRANAALGIGRGLAAIRFAEPNTHAFGWHAVNHAKGALGSVTQGSTFKAIDGQALRSLPILLPPLPEQRAIAAVLDAIDESIECTEAVIAAAGRLRDALLHELLTRGVPGWHTQWKDGPGIGTIPAAWDVVRLGDVAEVQTGRAVNRKAHQNGSLEAPYLSVANVKDGYLDLDVVKTMLVAPFEINRYRLLDGDVLFTEGGDADKLGRGTVWRNEIALCLHQNHIFAVRPSQDTLYAEFLAAFAASSRGKQYFLGAAKQTTNLASMNATQLRQMPLPLPSPQEQRAIVSVLDGLSGMIQQDATGAGWVAIIEGSGVGRAVDGTGADSRKVGITNHAVLPREYNNQVRKPQT